MSKLLNIYCTYHLNDQLYEYIDCEDGFEFYKGNYKIKTI